MFANPLGQLKNFRRRTWWALASGAALALAYPLFDLNLLAWLALTPMAWILVEEAEHGMGTAVSATTWARAAFTFGFAGGFAFHIIGIYWLLAIPVTMGFKALLFIGYVLLAAYLALYFGAWTAALALFARVVGVNAAHQRIGVCALAAAAWVALEWVRSWMLGGFPWNFLGASQHQMISVIQLAQWTGVFGVSALVCFVNMALAFTARRFWKRLRVSSGKPEPRSPQGAPFRSGLGTQISWEFTIAMFMVMGLVMTSARSMTRDAAAVSRPLTVALVQGNVKQELKWDDAQGPAILDDYRRLTLQAATASPHLIVWPETATPPPDFALRVTYEGDAETREVKYLRVPYDLVTSLARETRAPLLVGSIDVIAEKEPPKTKAMFNAAFLVEPDKALGEPYRKMRLVPFGEYVPWSGWLPFMKWLTPIHSGFEAGADYTIFPLESASAAFGTVICFEDVMPDHCRHFAARGADFLVTITNDAWFGRTAGAYQHAANSVFRAVENRRPLLRCANTGMTCVVDARGRVVKILEGAPREKIFVQGVLTHTLRLPENPSTTFYSRHGNFFAWSCAALSVLTTALGAWRWRRRSQSMPE